MADLAGLKEYGGIYDDASGVPLLCLNAAKGWFERAGVPEPETPCAEYDLGVYLLATHYYDHRAVMTDGTVTHCEAPYGVMSIRNQLKHKKRAAAGGGT